MWPLITQNVRPPKCRHRLPKMSDHPKCRHRKLKMLVPTTQNVSTDHPKCPTTQNVRPPKMSAPTTQNVWPPKTSAPKTQNVGTDHPKCPTTQNVGTENSKCRHRLHYTIDAVSVAMGNVDVRWLYSTVCAPYSIPYIIHWLNEFAEPISYDTVCPFGGPYHMIHCNSAMCQHGVG